VELRLCGNGAVSGRFFEFFNESPVPVLSIFQYIKNHWFWLFQKLQKNWCSSSKNRKRTGSSLSGSFIFLKKTWKRTVATCIEPGSSKTLRTSR
jgi:hypothetical protein